MKRRGDGELLERVAGSFHSWRSTEKALEDLNRGEQEKLQMLDLWATQRKEIETLGLVPDEDAGLENEKRVLRNVTALQENAQAAYGALSEDPIFGQYDDPCGAETAGGAGAHRRVDRAAGGEPASGADRGR